MEKLRTAVKNGADIVAECPISCQCETLPLEDGGVTNKCGYLRGFLKSGKSLKVRCGYLDK